MSIIHRDAFREAVGVLRQAAIILSLSLLEMVLWRGTVRVSQAKIFALVIYYVIFLLPPVSFGSFFSSIISRKRKSSIDADRNGIRLCRRDPEAAGEGTKRSVSYNRMCPRGGTSELKIYSYLLCVIMCAIIIIRFSLQCVL